MEDYSKRSNSPPSYVGRIWLAHLPNGYTSGGAGYLISNRAAKLMIHEGPKKDGCPQSGGVEDLDIAKYVFIIVSHCRGTTFPGMNVQLFVLILVS